MVASGKCRSSQCSTSSGTRPRTRRSRTTTTRTKYFHNWQLLQVKEVVHCDTVLKRQIRQAGMLSIWSH
eukprot:5123555-Prorocentrum_lima.AAC.1